MNFQKQKITLILAGLFGLLILATPAHAIKIVDTETGRELSVPTVISGFTQHVTANTSLSITEIASLNLETTDYLFFEYEITDLSLNTAIESKIFLKDSNGQWWEQNDTRVAFPRKTNTFLVSLSPSNWINPQLRTQHASTQNLSTIQGVRIQTKAPTNSTLPYTFLRSGGILCETWATPDNSPFRTFSTDRTAPTLRNLTIDNQPSISGDYISEKPQISLIALDSGDGIATWSIQLKNEATQAVAQQLAGNGQHTTTEKQITFNVSTALPEGKYQLLISVSDAAGNTATSSLDNLCVKTELSLETVLNSPNPFNPNRESTKIDYRLSKEAEVKAYIYAQNGELQESFVFHAGDNGGKIGYNEFNWTGKNRFNETVSNGIYILYLVAESGGKVQKGKCKLWVRK